MKEEFKLVVFFRSMKFQVVILKERKMKNVNASTW